MCVPDLTIFTHDWVEGRDDEPMPNHAVKHACVNWSELEEWVEERRFDLADKMIQRADGNSLLLEIIAHGEAHYFPGTVWPNDLD